MSSHSFNGKPISNTIKKLISRSMLLKKGIAASVLWTKIVCVRYGPHVYPSISMSHLPTLWGCQKTLVHVLYIFGKVSCSFYTQHFEILRNEWHFFFGMYITYCYVELLWWYGLNCDKTLQKTEECLPDCVNRVNQLTINLLQYSSAIKWKSSFI